MPNAYTVYCTVHDMVSYMHRILDLLPAKALCFSYHYYLKAFDKRDLSRDEVSALSPPASPQRGGQPKYTPLTWQEVGRSLLLA